MTIADAGALARQYQGAEATGLKTLAEAARALPALELVRRFAAYGGPLFLDLAAPVMSTIEAVCRGEGLADPAGAVGTDGRIDAGLLRRLGLRDVAYPAQRIAAPETTIGLLDPCPNANQSDDLPRPIANRILLPECPALDLHGFDRATLYVTPSGFQLLDRDGCAVPGAGSRAFTTKHLAAPAVIVERPVVLIQDIYPSANFAHFLLDWTTRLAMFTAHGPVPAGDCLFVLGGIPGEFHRIVLARLRRPCLASAT